MSLQGQLADFGAFYERTYPDAFRVAYGIVADRALADDVTQDAYTAAYRERARYRGDGPPEAWLYRIVVNTAIAALRHQRVRWIVPLDPDGPDRPADGGASMIDHAAVTEGLQRLDPRSRGAVVLRYYLDLDYAAIATILGISSTNVGAILSRSLDRLRGYIAPTPITAAAPPVPAALAKEGGRHG
jgi:RNA polymerase sigma-70 factor (ECF subfamily)